MRDTAGSAAAPAARCKNLRRGSLTRSPRVPPSQGRIAGYRISSGQSAGMARMLEVPAHGSLRSFAATYQVRFSALYGLAPDNYGAWGYINKSWRPLVPSELATRAQTRLRHSPSAARR